MVQTDFPKYTRMLVFHSAYTFEYLKEFGMEIFVQARDAGNLFEEVLTVSPIANLQYGPENPLHFSKPMFYSLDSKNIILEGKTSRFRILKRFPVLNFFLAQTSLLYTIFKSGQLREVQLVRSEDMRLNGIYGLFFSRILRVPFVVGIWGNPGRLRRDNQKPNMPQLFPSMRSEEIVEKFVLRRASAVFAQNTENMSYAFEAGVTSDKTYFTQLGVGLDKSHFLPREARRNVKVEFESWGIKEEIIIACVSRLETLKMVDHAIKSCSVLVSYNINFKLLIIGDGRELKNLKLLAKELDLIDKIIFTGNMPQEWIAGAFNHIDINVAPLCGRSLLEASLGGVPAVAYEIDWHADIVKSGETGYLVPNLDIAELGNKVLELCLNHELRIQMGQNILAKASELANPKIIANRQKSIYLDLIEKRENLQGYGV